MALAWRAEAPRTAKAPLVASFRDLHSGPRAMVRSATVELALRRLAQAANGRLAAA
jgi:hypothetical protein